MTERARAVSLGLGGRLAAEPDPVLVETAFADELAAQLDLAWAVGLADLAHVVVLVEDGVIPRAAGCRLLALLLELETGAADLRPDPGRGDLYTNRETWLQVRDPEAASWLGIGRARREATTVALRLALRVGILDLASALLDLLGVVDRRATEDGDTSFPDYTYLQVAQGGTWGHYLLGVAQPPLRHLTRIRDLWSRLDRAPAGVAGGLGSRLPIDRARIAAALGFAAPVAHSRDATWQADVVLETIGLATICLIDEARLAEELIVFSAREFGLVEPSDGFARASRALPQKRNPFALTWIRGLANRALGAWAGAAAAQRTPTGMPDGRLEATRAALATLRTAGEATRLLTATLRSLRLDREAIERSLRGGDAAAPDLAEGLTALGVPWSLAHRAVARLVRDLRARRLGLVDASSEAVKTALTEEGHDFAAWPVQAEAVDRLLSEVRDPALAAASRRGLGGTAPERVAELVAELRQALEAERRWVRARQGALDRSRSELLDRARRIASEAVA